jgi:serine-type anaerobic sulfatase-maturating enzyme
MAVEWLLVGPGNEGRVMRGLDMLKRHQVDWNVLTTVHAANGDHGRHVYTFLRDNLGAMFIQLSPSSSAQTSRASRSPMPAGVKV